MNKKQNIAGYLSLLFIGGLIWLSAKPTKHNVQPPPVIVMPAQPSEPSSPGLMPLPEIVEQPAPELSKSSPQGYDFPTVIQPDWEFQTHIRHLGNNIWYIANRTGSFADLAWQAKSAIGDQSGCLVDIHFNAGGGSRHDHFPTNNGVEFARYLQEEFDKIYKQEKFVHKNQWDSITTGTRYTILKRSREIGLPAMISEFGFHDDPNNDMDAFLKSKRGQYLIGKAFVNAADRSKYDKVVLSIGHWGPRGFGGATASGGFHETDYSHGIVNAIQFITQQPGKGVLSAYSPKYGASNVPGAGGEGGYESAVPGPDGLYEVRTLQDVKDGTSEYLTIAGSTKFYGNKYTIPRITYVYWDALENDFVYHTMRNVKAVVHDTGSSFNYAPEHRWDIPIAKDKDDYLMSLNHAAWKKEPVSFVEGW